MTTWSALRPVFQLFTRASHRRQLLTGMLLAVATVLFGMALLGLSVWPGLYPTRSPPPHPSPTRGEGGA